MGLVGEGGNVSYWDASSPHQNTVRVRTLNAIVERAVPALEQGSLDDPAARDVVRRADMAWGETLIVTTKNSTYAINRASADAWFVWGGWFERHGQVPMVVGINGCTWGGSVIYAEILAAPGLFLEFANGVTTTRIRSVQFLRKLKTGSIHL